MTSYRFAGGRLVARTAEEHAELQRRKGEAVAPLIRAKSTERFVLIKLQQLDTLFGLKSRACTLLFMVMLYENFRHRGKPFILSADKIAANGGFSRRTQRRAVLRLEACGLISVKRRNRTPPEIAVL